MAKRRNARSAAAQRTEKIIQYAAIGLVLIVLAFIVWPLIPKRKTAAPVANTPSANVPAAASSAACAAYNSIPAARQYASPPPMKVDQAKQYFANVTMATGGEFVIQLYADKAPITVNSFVFLACKRYFDGVTFHRVLDGFMAQGGDPDGTGMGGPGYEFVNENSDLTFDKDGVVAMANAGPDTNGSQFFITYGPQDFLNGGYTIFGQVISGMDVVNGLTRRDPDQNPGFTGDAIGTITITVQ